MEQEMVNLAFMNCTNPVWLQAAAKPQTKITAGTK